MAKKTRKPPKVDIKSLSYMDLRRGLEEGQFTESNLRNAYNRLRNIVNKAVMKTQASEYRFDNGEVPWFPMARDLSGRDLVKAASDIGKLIRGQNYTVRQRKQKTDATLLKIKRSYAARFDIPEGEIDSKMVRKIGRFYEWFKGTAFFHLFASDSAEVEEAFTSGSTVREWTKLLNDFVAMRTIYGDERL